MTPARSALVLALLAFSPFAISAPTPQKALTVKNSPLNAPSFDLQNIPLNQVVPLIFSQVLTTPYVIGPALLADSRLVSFRFASNQGDLPHFITNFLDAFGYTIQRKDGVSYVIPTPKPTPPDTPTHVFTYTPHYRSVDYLTRILRPLFTHADFTATRQIPTPPGAQPVSKDVPPQSASALLDQSSDLLIFSGTDEQIQKLRLLLPEVDTPTPQIIARAVVYEVNTTNTTGNSFQLALNLLGGKLGVSLGGQPNTIGNYAQIKAGSFDAVIQSLDGDSHFRAISSPILRINSGSTGSFNVGDSVPTLGSITLPQNGGPAVQSVTYQQSGIIFTLSPTVYADDVTMHLDQQISSFIPTSNGVNASPTLTRRDLQTTVSMQSGQTIILGGLSVANDTSSTNGVPFLPSFFNTRTSDKLHQDIILVLHISTITPSTTPSHEAFAVPAAPVLPPVRLLPQPRPSVPANNWPFNQGSED